MSTYARGFGFELTVLGLQKSLVAAADALSKKAAGGQIIHPFDRSMNITADLSPRLRCIHLNTSDPELALETSHHPAQKILKPPESNMQSSFLASGCFVALQLFGLEKAPGLAL